MSRRSRSTILPTALGTAAIAASVVLSGGSANAEAIVYERHDVAAKERGETIRQAEHASLKIPTGYDVDKLNWHRWVWFEPFDGGQAIILDLEPKADTLRKLKAERAALIEDAGDSYEEFAFVVNEPGSKVRARWTFTYTEPNTGNVDPYVSVVLTVGGNRVQVAGSLQEKDLADRVRRDVVRSLRFPS